ncbi:hypothetical protein QQX09_07925 [Demequina sp. SYSU T00192]|uniref:Uncharacterized protein n=1 Tax=Demequina litoralis TaxID=3051660 RepID=A0ABT8G9P5_9MICO|nr:hypothetical protein [Demequina sp. SYSU T00192]MDN4475782.1 hypothetical protein [Demequina sp. SYSU T00192]
MSTSEIRVSPLEREQVELARIRVQALTNLGETPDPRLQKLAETDLGDGIRFTPRRLRRPRRLLRY